MISINIRDYSGTYYVMGLAHGRWLRNSQRFQDLVAKVVGLAGTHQDTGEIKTVLSEYCPQLLEEMNGLADGLEIPRQDALRWFGGYDLPALQMGCTSFMTSGYYVRNYDFSPDIYDGTFLIQPAYTGQLHEADAESRAHRFFGKDELPGNLNPRQRQFIMDWAEGTALPVIG